jgi:hypothetical protein
MRSARPRQAGCRRAPLPDGQGLWPAALCHAACVRAARPRRGRRRDLPLAAGQAVPCRLGPACRTADAELRPCTEGAPYPAHEVPTCGRRRRPSARSGALRQTRCGTCRVTPEACSSHDAKPLGRRRCLQPPALEGEMCQHFMSQVSRSCRPTASPGATHPPRPAGDPPTLTAAVPILDRSGCPRTRRAGSTRSAICSGA